MNAFSNYSEENTGTEELQMTCERKTALRDSNCITDIFDFDLSQTCRVLEITHALMVSTRKRVAETYLERYRIKTLYNIFMS